MPGAMLSHSIQDTVRPPRESAGAEGERGYLYFWGQMEGVFAIKAYKGFNGLQGAKFSFYAFSITVFPGSVSNIWLKGAGRGECLP